MPSVYSIEVHNDAGTTTATTLITNPGTGIAAGAVPLLPDYNFTITSPTGVGQTLFNFTNGNEQHPYPQRQLCSRPPTFDEDVAAMFFGVLSGSCRR